MRHRALVLATALLLSSSLPGTPTLSTAAAGDPDLAAGIALVKEGDFEAAILKLDAASRRLQADPSRRKEAAQALVYLAVAFLELDQEASTRGKFQAALALDPQLHLDPREFSPQQIRVFESVRPAPAPPVVAAAAPPEKKKKRSPVVWILGGAAVLGGGAALAGGGGGGGAQPTTTTPAVGNTTSTTTPATTPSDTTTTTTQPGQNPPPTTTTTTTTVPTNPTTTVPGTPTTTTTTTTTTLPPTTTTTTTTTTLPACNYAVGPPSMAEYPPAAGSGYCDVVASTGCSWIADAGADWVNFQSATGSGNGRINFSLTSNLLQPDRSTQIRLRENTSASCTVRQRGGLLLQPQTGREVTFASELDLDGGQGQVIVDGAIATFQERGSRQGTIENGPALHRIEATVVSTSGRPGTWRFRLSGPVVPGTLRIVAGKGAIASDHEVLFRLTGMPDERLLFFFRIER